MTNSQFLRRRAKQLVALAAVDLAAIVVFMAFQPAVKPMAVGAILMFGVLVTALVLTVQTATLLGWSTLVTGAIAVGCFIPLISPVVLLAVAGRCQVEASHESVPDSGRVHAKRAHWAD